MAANLQSPEQRRTIDRGGRPLVRDVLAVVVFTLGMPGVMVQIQLRGGDYVLSEL